MTCKHCGKEIILFGSDYVHAQHPYRYRCVKGAAPDPQTYAEPDIPIIGAISKQAAQ